MHTLSLHIVCLLVAQIGPQGYPSNPQLETPPVVRSAVPGSSTDVFSQQPPAAISERTAQPAAHAAIGTATIPLHSKDSQARAEALVEQFIVWDRGAIEGKPFTLLACVERAATSGRQSATIRAYWQLCMAIGRYHQAEENLVVLAAISPQFKFEQLQLHAAQRSAEARRAQARVDLLSAQEKLGEVAELPDDALPLPADRPFVGKYRTRLTTMYAGRTIPRQLRKVDRALPHQLRLIEQRAEAVDANTRLSSDVALLYQQGQVPLSMFLSTSLELLDQQDAFLSAVVNYNQQIASYSLLVVGTALSSKSLVSTLIRPRSATAPRIFRDRNVLPATSRQLEPANVRPAFEPDVSPGSFESRTPANGSRSVYDENSPYRIQDSPYGSKDSPYGIKDSP
jgi:hypothetical protein